LCIPQWSFASRSKLGGLFTVGSADATSSNVDRMFLAPVPFEPATFQVTGSRQKHQHGGFQESMYDTSPSLHCIPNRASPTPESRSPRLVDRRITMPAARSERQVLAAGTARLSPAFLGRPDNDLTSPSPRMAANQ
jgi:hypothetical protein